MQLWHATRHLTAVLVDGVVRPMRLPHVYAFTTKEAAERYTNEFGYEAVVELAYDGEPIVRRWRPSYAHGAEVVKIAGMVRIVHLCERTL